MIQSPLIDVFAALRSEDEVPKSINTSKGYRSNANVPGKNTKPMFEDSTRNMYRSVLGYLYDSVFVPLINLEFPQCGVDLVVSSTMR